MREGVNKERREGYGEVERERGRENRRENRRRKG